MTRRIKRATAGIAIALAGSLPLDWLRAANRALYRTSWGRRALKVAWKVVAERPVVIPRGPLAGFRFVSGGGQPEYVLGASEPNVQKVLQSLVGADDILYDVGANVGFFTLLGAKLVNGTGRVYAFEPIEANVRALRRNVELNRLVNVEVETLAVSDVVTTLRMSPGHDQATGHLAEEGDDLITVQSTAIDAFVSSGHRPPSFVKIDVEGAEDLVLMGAQDTLRNVRPLVLCEIHYDADDTRREKISAIFDDASYGVLMLSGGSMPHVIGVPTEMREHVLQRLFPHALLADVP